MTTGLGPSIGLVGFGRWGKHILRDLTCIGASVHVAVPSALSREAAKLAGAAMVHETVEEFPSLDGYIVATPTVLHADTVHRLLSRRRPIFVEKPLTNDVIAARRLVETAGDRIFVMDKWRYHPGVRELALQAQSGAIGDILSIRTYRLGWGNPHTDVDAVWILLPHDLSIVLEILGRIPEAQNAYCAGREGSEMTAFLRDDAADIQVAIEVSTNHPIARRSVVVRGTRGAIQLADSYDDRIFLARDTDNTATPEEIEISKDLPLLLELKAFVDYLAGGPPPRSSGAEGLMIVESVARLRSLAGLR